MSDMASLTNQVVALSIERRGYVVLRFTPGHPYKPGDIVKVFCFGPVVTVTEQTDQSDWGKQAKLAQEVTGHRQLRTPKGTQYYRAVPVNGGAA